MPSNGPLKKPMMAAAVCRSEPMWAKYTPIAAKVTTMPQARVIQRAPRERHLFRRAGDCRSRWRKSMHVAVLREFKPDENTDIVAANSPAKTRPARAGWQHIPHKMRKDHIGVLRPLRRVHSAMPAEPRARVHDSMRKIPVPADRGCAITGISRSPEKISDRAIIRPEPAARYRWTRT